MPPIFFLIWTLSSIISYPEAKVNKNWENFFKKFFKKYLTFGSKVWYNKRGRSIFFFFFFWGSAGYACSSSSQLQLRYARRRCRAGTAGTLPHSIWSPPEPNKCLSIDFTWFFVIIMLGVEKNLLYIEPSLDTRGCVVFPYYI